MKTKVLNLLKGGAKGGLGFGVAIGIIHLAVGIGYILSMGMPPMTWFAAKSILIEVPVVVMIGVLLGPVHLLEKGRYIHPVLLAAVSIVLEWYLAIDPSKLQMWLAPSLAALGFFYLFQWVAKKRLWPVVAVSVGAPLALLAAPIVAYQAGGYDAQVVEKGATPPKGAPDVVFVVYDTVRAESVSAYGYERKTTPVFDEFAKKGALFERATAPSTWSLPAHASLFTGTFPSFHEGHAETRWLDHKLPTLAQTLAKAGFDTLCFTANPHISPSFGLTRGFGWKDNAWITGAGGRGFSFIYRLVDALGIETTQDKGGGLVVDNVRNWMAKRSKDAPPAFVFVNFLEAHFPFHQLPERFRYAYTKEPLSDLRSYGQIAFGAQVGRQITEEELKMIHQPILDLYDGGILYTDYLFGQILDIWRKRGTLEKTLFVVLADHGEHVGEHGMIGHHTSLYEQDLWVPFMLYYPPRIKPGQRVAQEVSTAGTFATIFDLLNLKAPDTLQVGSLMPALEKPGAAFGRPVISERYEEHLLSSRFKPGTANGKGPLLSPFGRYRVYRTGPFKLAKHFADGKLSTHLFHLERDPEEMQDLAAEPWAKADLTQIEGELRSWEVLLKLPALDGKAGSGAGAKQPELTDQAREQLKALGYIE
jgi:arylsulfatase A-like enzyme